MAGSTDERIRRAHAGVLAMGLVVGGFSACSATNEGSSFADTTSGAGGSSTIVGTGGAGGEAPAFDAGSGGGAGVVADPKTCGEAEAGGTYVGCDFWPTVVDNIVRPQFDYAVVVANTGDADAEITVSRGATEVAKAVAPAGGLVKLFLPWVSELKETTPDNGCGTNLKTQTVTAKAGAYHLVSTRPVAVYQFNAIEYAAKGGPPGKDWVAACEKNCFGTLDCFSYTNDASLLLPTHALTGHYRVAGKRAWNDGNNVSDSYPDGYPYPPYFAVTGTETGTVVTVNVSPTGAIAGGGGVPETGGGGSVTFTVDAGDVVLVVGRDKTDLSGTLVAASAPVQVITGMACTNVPSDRVACDHIEESLLPAETLGKHYFVPRPTAPDGNPGVHTVRLYGNVDGTALTYPGQSVGGPATISAGEVVELVGVSQDFEVVGDHELMVGTFLHGAGTTNGKESQGDPSQSFATTVEQYRKKYVFLAPDDYDESFADVVMPMDAKVTIDGQALPGAPTAVSSGFGVARVKLGPGPSGAHVLQSDEPVGLQVIGYGAYTSYQYPGGLNLGHIAPPPLK
jgi:hypothetical protein